jgi:hypothetical protein
MRNAKRYSLALAAVAALASACVWSSLLAIDDDVGFDVTQVMYAPIPDENIAVISAQLHAHDASTVPEVQELMGVFDLHRRDAESLAEADVHFRRALELRPVSANTWANLLMQRYLSGDTGAEFQVALARAAQLGPHEPQVQAVLADYGLAVFDELPEANRLAVESAVANGMHRAPAYFLHLAQRRGRLEVACRHFEHATRQVDSKWTQICQSMEATS